MKRLRLGLPGPRRERAGEPGARDIIEALRETGSVPEAARRLGVPRERGALVASILAGSGMARPLAGGQARGCDCGSCPLRRLCGRG